jgi:putative FmdB family regulatory protein
MPVYVYRCHDCKKTFEKRHGMFFEQKMCIHCYGDNIFKVPSIEYTGKKSASTTRKVGKVVDDYIKEAKEEIKKEKKALQSEEM